MSTSASPGWMRSALVALLVVVASCAGQSDALGGAGASQGDALDDDVPFRHAEDARPSQAPLLGGDGGLLHPVVLVTIDGVRWQEIFEGTDAARTSGPVRSAAEIVPNLHVLSHERGAALGAPRRGVIAASGPEYLSLPGYTEIMTGRTSRVCKNNECAGSDTPTLLDEARAAGAKVAAFTSWDLLARAVSVERGAARTFQVSSGRASDPAVRPWPGDGEYRPDKLTMALAAGFLERERPDVLYVGLGDTDEHAHHGDYDAYVEALSEADAFVGRLREILDRMGPRGQRTHLVVTADHGRAADFRSHGGATPEAARVWLVASGPGIVARGHVGSSRVRHLADVAPTLRAIVGLAPDPSPGAGSVLDELFGD
jgi:hypothetical protein